MRRWISRVLLTVLWAATVVCAYGLGGLIGIYQPETIRGTATLALQSVRALMPGPCEVDDTTTCGFSDTDRRIRVDCAPFTHSGPERAVLFAFGQSNSANVGQYRYTAQRDVVNFNPHDGHCYHAEDPLLGPDGHGGSVWGILGDQLIDAGLYDKVLVVPFGIGGTSIARWAPGGDLHARVRHTARRVLDAGIEPTHVLWHQGEADAGSTTGERYTELFRRLVGALREYGIDAPVYPAVATICNNHGNEELRAAQTALPGEIAGVKPGPNTDTLTGPVYRFDRCHFNAAGMRTHAQLWLRAIEPQ